MAEFVLDVCWQVVTDTLRNPLPGQNSIGTAGHISFGANTYCGADSSNDHIINVPLAAGSGSDEFRKAVKQYWLPALARFQPELLLVSAGFDAHRDDTMSMLNLNESDYAWVTTEIKQFASGRIVSALEGGYDLNSLARSAAEHIRVLLNQKG